MFNSILAEDDLLVVPAAFINRVSILSSRRLDDLCFSSLCYYSLQGTPHCLHTRPWDHPQLNDQARPRR